MAEGGRGGSVYSLFKEDLRGVLSQYTRGARNREGVK